MPQMLDSLRVKNFRSYHDSGEIPLSRINIFLGPNNAGKSSILACIELMLRSMQSSGESPLRLREIPAFGSFDSVLRRHWSSKENRPKGFEIEYRINTRSDKKLDFQFYFEEDPHDGTAEVHAARYAIDKDWFRINFKTKTLTSSLDSKKVALTEEDRFFFHQAMPLGGLKESSKLDNLISKFVKEGMPHWADLEVVNAYRPVPRNLYVTDDPTMSAEDRGLISYLAGLWASDKESQKAVRARIVSSLSQLGLSTLFEVKPASTRRGGGVFELRVAPSSARQKVSIADAGFGLSQVLPLVVYEARLERGTLLAYQPEVHLHPAAQAKLADIFVNSAKRGNQIFVETHSVDLILRMQYLIARGDIAANEVDLFFVENKSGKSSIKRVEFSDVGSPSVPFPSGFLDVSYTLAKDLIEMRMKRQKPLKTARNKD